MDVMSRSEIASHSRVGPIEDLVRSVNVHSSEGPIMPFASQLGPVLSRACGSAASLSVAPPASSWTRWLPPLSMRRRTGLIRARSLRSSWFT